MFDSDTEEVLYTYSHNFIQIYLLAVLPVLPSMKTSKIETVEILPIDWKFLKHSIQDIS